MVRILTRAKRKRNKSERAVYIFIYFAIFIALVALVYSVGSMFSKQDKILGVANQGNMQVVAKSGLKFTSYDRELARKLMDKNNDGKCDACGMPVEMCIDTGQLQCNMDPKSTIGELNTAHIHADWKIYINGRALDLLNRAHMDRMKNNLPVSSFIHVDSGNQLPEKTGDILHMHAKGVPLWIFFESIELDLPEGMKAYVNGNELSDYKNYIFKDLDKILITDSKGDLQQQLNSITDFAKSH